MSAIKLTSRFLPHVGKRYQSTSVKTLSDVPGPKNIPFIGNFLNFRGKDGLTDQTESVQIVQHQWEKHGDLVRVTIPFKNPVIFIFDPDYAKKVYIATGAYPERPGFDALGYIRSQDEEMKNSQGLLTSKGHEWYTFRRKVQQPMMRPKSTLRYTHDLDDIAEEFICEKVLAGRDPKTFQVPQNFVEDLYKWALESVTFLALNSRLGCLKSGLDENSEQMVIIRAVSNIFLTTMHLDNGFQLWKYFPSPKLHKFQDGYNVFKNACTNHIYKALEEIKTRKDEDRSDPTLLEMFMARGCDETTAVVMALDMMFAGVDTSSHTTAFALYWLAKNPDVQEKLFQEILKELPKDSSKLSENSIERMPYLKAVFKETLRKNPPVAVNARILNQPLQLADYHLPSGVLYAIGHYHMSNSDRFVANAKEFKPERWLKSHQDYQKIHPFVILPFGQGPRMCIGHRFAKLETSILIAKLIRRFKVEWHNPDLGMKTETITKPSAPLKFTFLDR